VERRALQDWVLEDDVFFQENLPLRMHCMAPMTIEQELALNKRCYGGVNYPIDPVSGRPIYPIEQPKTNPANDKALPEKRRKAPTCCKCKGGLTAEEHSDGWGICNDCCVKRAGIFAPKKAFTEQATPTGQPTIVAVSPPRTTPTTVSETPLTEKERILYEIRI